MVASGVASSVASLVSSADVGLFGSSGVSVPSVGVPPLGSQSLPSSFAPWVASSFASASSWSFSPALVSSVASVSSSSVSFAGNVGFPHSSPFVVGSSSSSSAFAGSCFAMSSLLAPVSTVVSSVGMSSGVSVSWLAPSVVPSVPRVVWSSVAGSVPGVPVSEVASAVTVGGVDGSAAHRNTLAISAPEGSVGVFADPLAFAEGDDTAAGSRSEPHRAFKQVVALITGLIPEARPSVLKLFNPASWFRGFGDEKQRDPKVFLSCFDRIRSVMTDVEERSTVAFQVCRKAISVLPSWGEIYRMSDFPTFAKAPPVNDQFSRLDKPLASSYHVTLSLESQSYSSWAMAAVFAYLCEAGVAPEDDFSSPGFESVSFPELPG